LPLPSAKQPATPLSNEAPVAPTIVVQAADRAVLSEASAMAAPPLQSEDAAAVKGTRPKRTARRS